MSCFKFVDLFIRMIPTIVKIDCGTKYLGKSLVVEPISCFKVITVSVVDLMQSSWTVFVFWCIGYWYPISLLLKWKETFEQCYRCNLFTNFKSWQGLIKLFWVQVFYWNGLWYDQSLSDKKWYRLVTKKMSLKVPLKEYWFLWNQDACYQWLDE